MKILLALLVAILAAGLSPARAQSFDAAGLAGVSLLSPTSLQFGPDGRLYVAQQNGLIKAFTVARQGTGYRATATELIAVVQSATNHDDDGSVSLSQGARQVTGILVTGTASAPVIYVTSSDPRIGGGGGGADVNLDTNSGMVSVLTRSAGGVWSRLDLVRGLPRSEENHASNGMQLSPDGATLYLAQGGNTNAGAPSNNFAFANEAALSAAILTVDLAAINALPTRTAADGSAFKYDLPTVDDPTRANLPDGSDPGDPWGGNDGLNQARWVAGGPVQPTYPGYRNPYDVVLTADGRLYTWDNGANGGWGGHPAQEGVGTATNAWVPGEPGSSSPGPNDGQVNNKDGLHFITGPNYYGGHPNPIRANPTGAGLFTQSGTGGGAAGVWRTSNTDPTNPLPADWPPVPPALARGVEGDFRNAGVDDGSLFTVVASTNGMCEYTATAFGGAMAGDLLAASFNGNLYRVHRNAAGSIDGPGDVTILASGFGGVPLDVTAQGDDDPFPGTIWAATYGANALTVFTPAEATGCAAANDPALDEDGDGYANADEIANGTDPCSQASTPPDADGTLINGFKVSNRNDPDDDDDGLPDTSDPFALDATNGHATALPLDLPLLNGDPGTGFFGVGLTGLMTNGKDYLANLADEDNSSTEIIAGGAVGLFTMNGLGGGDAYGTSNTLTNGFQLGFPVTRDSSKVRLEVKALGPLWNGTPTRYQQTGLALGDGTQANYLKFVAIAAPTPVLEVLYEQGNALVKGNKYDAPGITTAAEVRFFLDLDPGAGTVQPGYDLGAGYVAVGPPITLSGKLLSTVQTAGVAALGLFATSGGAAPHNATYDYVRITPAGAGATTVEGPVNTAPTTALGSWTTIDGGPGASCAPLGQVGSCAQGRHEASYVQVGRKFYLLGGREHGSNVNVYDPATDTWTAGASPGFPVHHFQAVAFDGLIYAIGIFKDNNFPTEAPYERVLVYDPARDRWFDGPAIPAARRRGSAGCVAIGGQLYVVGGITNGHSSGWVKWLDRFDPASGTWTALADLPQARDHFHAAVHGGKIFAVGGRRSGGEGTFLPTVGAVDVYDVASDTWSTWQNPLPTERAAPAVAVVGNELLVIGGERDGSGAYNKVEALDLSGRTWRTLSPLNQGRHGTQAIVDGGTVYVAAGSPVRGGGTTQTQEAFRFSGSRPPVSGAALAAARVNAPTEVAWPDLAVGATATRTATLTHTGGNQGAVIEAVTVSGLGFALSGPSLTGRLLRPGATLGIPIKYVRPSGATPSGGELRIRTSAGGLELIIALRVEQGTTPPDTTGTADPDTTYTPDPTLPALHINAGGPAVVADGISYVADTYFSGGSAFRLGVPIGGTTADVIYQSERWGSSGVRYDIPLSSGRLYEVTLHFAEIHFVDGRAGGDPGKRVFDIAIEGETVAASFDINALTGSRTPQALTRTYRVALADDNLDIDFLKGAVENPKISAISIVPLQAGQPDPGEPDPTEPDPTEPNPTEPNPTEPNPTEPALYINAGGPTVTVEGITYVADVHFASGYAYSRNVAIAGTTADVLYHSERWGPSGVRYDVPVTAGRSYEVTLHFAEIYFVDGHAGGGAGKRVFDIAIEGQTVLADLDINAATGSRNPSALTRTFTVTPADGNLDIDLLKGAVENPKVSAISIVPLAPASALAADDSVDGGAAAPGTVPDVGGDACCEPDASESSAGAATSRTGFGQSSELVSLDDVRVFPNPSRGSLTVEASELPGNAVSIDVIDALGRRVGHYAFPAVEADRVQLTHDWPAGRYWLHLTVGEARRTLAVQVVGQ